METRMDKHKKASNLTRLYELQDSYQSAHIIPISTHIKDKNYQEKLI